MERWIYFLDQSQPGIYSWTRYRMRIHPAGSVKCNYISLSCLFVQSQFPVSCWLDQKMKLTVACSWDLLCLMYTRRTWPGAVVKCILQPAKGKRSCLYRRGYAYCALKLLILPSPSPSFKTSANPTQISGGRAGVTSVRQCFFTGWKSDSSFPCSQSGFCSSKLRIGQNKQLL